MAKVDNKLLWFVVLLYLLRLFTVPQINPKNDQAIRVTGTLNQEPKVSEKSQIFSLGQIKIIAPRYPEYNYNDRLTVTGKLKVKNIIRIPFLNYKIDDKVLIYPETIQIVSESIKPGIRGMVTPNIVIIRNDLRAFYQQSLPSPADGIVAGIILGDKSLIPKGFWEKLRLTGTLHIMVASGMNIALFSETVLAIFCLFLHRRKAVILLYLLIWLYVLLTGVSAPVVRAAIMASMIYFGQLIGRDFDQKKVLWLTGGVMLLVNPLLIFDIGFQLSFLATAGLIYIQPIINKWQKYFVFFKYSGFSSSIAALTLSLPVLVNSFGQLNLIAPIINLSVLWLIPYILLGGGLVGVIGLIIPLLGKYLVLLVYPLCFYVEQAINWFAKMTIFQIQVPKFSIPFWIVYYGIIWYGVKRANDKLT